MEKVSDLDENEIVEIVYAKINAFWGKFPNIWKYTTKDEIAAEVIIDLYRPRKADKVPHIIHYYNTRGERSLHSLIGMFVYNNLIAEARDIHSTGIRNNDDRRNVKSPLSLSSKISSNEDDSKTIEDTIQDPNVNISKEIDYIMLLDSLPDKQVDNVYYKKDNKYILVSYKSLLQKLIEGYKMSNISDMLYKQNKFGEFHKYNGISPIIKLMKQDVKQFLESEYGYTEEMYKKGYTIL